jgi:ankyrin repeat protein
MGVNAVAAVSVDAKLTVTADRGDCQQLKNLLNKEDSTPRPPSAVTMNPILLSSACSGSWEDLEFLLNSGSSQLHPSVRYSTEFLSLLMAYSSDSCSNNKGVSTKKASDDVEASLNQLPSVFAGSLLEGVTTEGGTALHIVAAYGDSDGFLRSADIIYRKAKHLLFVQNKNGDTPLHCASRAGMTRMVSRLISLARDEDNTSAHRVKELLEMENKVSETALHQAVRIGNNDIVKLLMEENPELASFPKDGTSPLYLAVLLEEDIIVETLYNASHMKLSYSGQNGQNALHAAVLRGTGTQASLSNLDSYYFLHIICMFFSMPLPLKFHSWICICVVFFY